MKVRGARVDDADTLLWLRTALWPDLPVDRQQQAIRLRSESPARFTTFLVEDDDGTVCGFLEATREPDSPGERARAVVDGVFVIPPARRRGMAGQLVEAAERWAHGRGAAILTCDLDLESADHLQAMGWLGFEVGEQRVRMHRSVSAPMEVSRAGPVESGSAAPVAGPSEPVLVMEPVRGRGFLYFNVALFVLAVVSFLNTDIYASDPVRGVLLPLLDVVFVIYFLFLFMMHRYRKRADSSARAEQLFRDGDP